MEPTTFVRPRFFRGALRRHAHWLCFAGLLAACAGGAADGGCDDGELSVDTVEQGLAAAGWRGWYALPQDTGGFTDSPGVCPVHVRSGYGASGYMLLGRSRTSNKFRMTIYEKLRPWMAWTDVGSGPTFNSRPACASLDELNLAPDSTWNTQLAVVGKRSSSVASENNRYYVQVMKLRTRPLDPDNDSGTAPPPPLAPTVVNAWTAIGTASWASAPASTVLGGHLVVVGRSSDNRISLYVNPLVSGATPYSHSRWEAAVATAALPSGWTAVGDPTIGHITDGGVGIVATRARDASSNLKIFTYRVDIPNRAVAGTRISQGTWNEVPVGYVAIKGDPALEYDSRIAGAYKATLYFRGNNDRIYQASGDGFRWEAFTLVDNPGDPSDDYEDFQGTPAVLGNSETEGGHLVVARRADNQLYTAGLIPGWGY